MISNEIENIDIEIERIERQKRHAEQKINKSPRLASSEIKSYDDILYKLYKKKSKLQREFENEDV